MTPPRVAMLDFFAGREAELERYLAQCGVLLPTEGLGDLPERWVPQARDDLEALYSNVSLAQMMDEWELVPGMPYPANWDLEKEDRPRAQRKRKAVQEDLIGGAEPVCCGALCILNKGRRR